MGYDRPKCPTMRCSAVLRGVLVGLIHCTGCGPTAEPKPLVEAKQPNVQDQFSDFVFGPTMRGEAPEGLELRPVAEIGIAHERRMKAIVIAARGGQTPAVSVDVWAFTQTGKEDLLTADAPPSLLIDVTGKQKSDANELEKLRADLARPRAVTTIPQGIEATNATAALTSLHDAAAAALNEQADGSARASALVTAIRGLDTELWLSSRLPKVLASLADSTFAVLSIEETSRRATATARSGDESMTLEAVRKSDGWVLMTAREN